MRQVGYVPPDRMAVYQVVGTQTKLLAVLDQAAVTCALSAYTAVVGGTTPWTGNGTTYTRTESLAAYTGRIPRDDIRVVRPAGDIDRRARSSRRRSSTRATSSASA